MAEANRLDAGRPDLDFIQRGKDDAAGRGVSLFELLKEL